jgi:hypothetical protein
MAAKIQMAAKAFPRQRIFKTCLHFSQHILKGQSHEIFDPWFFSLNGTPGSPAVLNIDSNSRRYSKNRGSKIS